MSAVFSRKYRRATIVCFIINIFNQYAGVSPVLMYAGRLLEKFSKAGNGASEFPITPLAGSIIIGFTSMISTMFAFFVIKYFGRKALLVMG